MDNQLIFQQSPTIQLGGNFFTDVPIILQYDTTPLMEVVTVEKAGFTTQFSIFHSDGTYLAKVKGSQLYLTEHGKKANLSLRHPGDATVCEMNGKELFELKRDQAAALKASAELYTPTGAFVKVTPFELSGFVIDNEKKHIQIGGVILKGCTFQSLSIGLLIKSDGSNAIGRT